MLNLRTLDPARQTSDRRVVMAFGYGLLAAAVFFAMAAGAGHRVLFTGIVIAIAGVSVGVRLQRSPPSARGRHPRRPVRVARRSRRRLGHRPDRRRAVSC